MRTSKETGAAFFSDFTMAVMQASNFQLFMTSQGYLTSSYFDRNSYSANVTVHHDTNEKLEYPDVYQPTCIDTNTWYDYDYQKRCAATTFRFEVER